MEPIQNHKFHPKNHINIHFPHFIIRDFVPKFFSCKIHNANAKINWDLQRDGRKSELIYWGINYFYMEFDLNKLNFNIE